MKGLAAEAVEIGRRSPGIDVMRGLAVLLVVLHHVHLRFQLNKYPVADLVPESIGRVLFWSGYYAVIAFFVISGFLITSLSFRRFGTLPSIPLRQFYWMRIARIVPCLLLLLIILSVLHWQGVTGFVIRPDRATLERALAAALTFHVNWLEGHRGYLPGSWDVLWSLSVEEVFYLLFPFVCVVVRRERWLLLALAGLLIIGPINRTLLAGKDPWESYAYLSCVDALAFGCLAAWVTARVQISRGILRGALTLGVAAILLIVVFRGTTTTLGLTGNGFHITALAFGVACVLVALANNLGNAVLSRGSGWLQFVGRCSYEIYLSHMFVVMVGMNLFKSTEQPMQIIPVAYLLMVLISVGLGYAIAKWFSEPANRWLRSRFAMQPRPAQAQPDAV